MNDHLWELPVLRYRCLYVGLPALEAEPFAVGGSPVGVALSALMRVPEDRRAWLKRTAMKRALEMPLSPWRKFLICECVDAYLPLDGPQAAEMERELAGEAYREVRDMKGTFYGEGYEAGEKAGVVGGERRLLSRQLVARFGPLSDAVRDRLGKLPQEKLEELAERLLTARSLQELGLED